MSFGVADRGKQASHESLQQRSPEPASSHAPAGVAAPSSGRGAMPGEYTGSSVFAGFGASDAGGDVGAQLGDSFGGSAMRQASSMQAPEQTADAGFTGTPMALPYKAELEQSFGRSLDGIEAYADPAAKHASSRLNANAYAAGNKIAFSSDKPSKSLVAHEVTHVLQSSGGMAAGGGAGIDTSGEHEAEKVEGAVAKGKPASSALKTDPRKAGAAAGGAIQRSTGRPARSANVIMTTFSPSFFEHGGTHELWAPHHPITFPTTVPLLNLFFEPMVTVNVAGGVDWSRHVAQGRATVDGSVGVGVSYGNHAVAEVYGSMEATASGGLRYEIGPGAGQEEGNHGGAQHGHAEAHGGSGHAGSGHSNNWMIDGSIKLETAFNVGVRLGGGIIDKRFQFGNLEIGQLTGLRWVNGQFQRGAVGWHWGHQIQAFFTEVQQQIHRAEEIMRAGERALEAVNPWNAVTSIAGWIYRGGSQRAQPTTRRGASGSW